MALGRWKQYFEKLFDKELIENIEEYKERGNNEETQKFPLLNV
jgi:hypothetical protein